jgi:translation initiation factor 4A
MSVVAPLIDSRQSSEEIESPSTTLIHKWDDLPISDSLLRGIYSCGFECPSSIQSKAIMPIIEKRDLIAQAQSGTGKTATFSIGMLNTVNISIPKIQAILISPTHELATQSAQVIRNIGSMMDGLVVQTLLGGTPVNQDINLLRTKTPHIVVGTPGRIYDLLRRKQLFTKSLKLIVLDEADNILSHGFTEILYNIFQYLPYNIQVALFSATFPNYILDLTTKIMRNPVSIMMKKEELNLECIQQFYVALQSDKEKYEMLKLLYSQLHVTQCIMYANSIQRVVDLYTMLNADGYPVSCIHGSMSKSEREHALLEFKSGETRILISSDITARGIDVQQVSIVINVDIPKSVHTYLHRIGRSGRWGRKGLAINLITRHDVHYLKEIEDYYKSNILELPANINLTNLCGGNA